MDPGRLTEWIVVAQTALVFVLGAFILVYEVVVRPVPDATAMGAGITLILAAPARAALYKWRQNGNGNTTPGKDEERWTHLP